MLEIEGKFYIPNKTTIPSRDLFYIVSYPPYQVYECVDVKNGSIYFKKIIGKDKSHIVQWDREIRDMMHWNDALYVRLDFNEEI